MTSVRPSQVRSRIVRAHDALRGQLDRLAVEMVALKEGHAGAVERALPLAKELLRALAQHLDLEDALLAPALREVDAWGSIRAERLLRHHEEQRAQLQAIAERDHAKSSASELAAVLGDLIEDLRADMAYEERDILSPDLLRDDVVTSGEDG